MIDQPANEALNLAGALADYLGDHRKHAYLVDEARRAETALGNRAEGMQKYVKEGLSTGDRFVDFELASSGRHFNLKRVERYRLVDAVLKGFEGQLILVVAHTPTDRTVQKMGDVGMGSKFYCGVLDHEELHLDIKSESPTCSLPTLSYFKEEGRRLKVGRITEGFRDGEYIGPFLLPIMEQGVFAEGLSEASVSRLVIGNDAVESWLCKYRPNAPHSETIRKMLTELVEAAA